MKCLGPLPNHNGFGKHLRAEFFKITEYQRFNGHCCTRNCNKLQNLSSLRDSQLVPDYPQKLFFLNQLDNQNNRFFDRLPLSI